jgi:hypothetical protein
MALTLSSTPLCTHLVPPSHPPSTQQDQLGRAEGYGIVHADQQFIVPTDGKPIRGLIQDHVIAGVLLTKRDTFLTKAEFSQLLYNSCRAWSAGGCGWVGGRGWVWVGGWVAGWVWVVGWVGEGGRGSSQLLCGSRGAGAAHTGGREGALGPCLMHSSALLGLV